jgi:hypothetical protein
LSQERVLTAARVACANVVFDKDNAQS